MLERLFVEGNFNGVPLYHWVVQSTERDRLDPSAQWLEKRCFSDIEEGEGREKSPCLQHVSKEEETYKIYVPV